MDTPPRWLVEVSSSAKEVIKDKKSKSEMDQWLRSLAENAEEYLEEWKDFETQIGSLKAQKVGSYMLRVWNKAHELVSCAREGHQASPGEFAEIIDDFGRYATIMNRLMNKGSNDLLNKLHDKVEKDCAFLKGKALKFKQSPGLPEVCYTDLDLGRPPYGGLGHPGAYACVYKARWNGEGLGSMVAVKQFKTGCQHHLQGELVRLKCQALDSSHILKLLGRSDSSNEEEVFLILELMDQDLEMLNQNGNQSRSQLSRSPIDLVEIIIQMAKGMRFLHSQNVIHRDLKPRNILLKKESGTDTDNQHYLVKVADFGNSKGDFCDYTIQGGPKLCGPPSEDYTMEQGTGNYMAPEMKKDVGQYTRSVDVFSFGKTCTTFLSNIEQSSLKNLITQSTEIDHFDRPSFEVICEELWIVMQELLAVEHYDPPPPEPLKDPRVQGDFILHGTIQVSFELTWLYCVTSWMRIFRDGRALIIKTERSSGPAKAINYEYKIASEDAGNVIVIVHSVQYPRWSATIDLGNDPPELVMKMMATPKGYASLPLANTHSNPEQQSHMIGLPD